MACEAEKRRPTYTVAKHRVRTIFKAGVHNTNGIHAIGASDEGRWYGSAGPTGSSKPCGSGNPTGCSDPSNPSDRTNPTGPTDPLWNDSQRRRGQSQRWQLRRGRRRQRRRGWRGRRR